MKLDVFLVVSHYMPIFLVKLTVSQGAAKMWAWGGKFCVFKHTVAIHELRVKGEYEAFTGTGIGRTVDQEYTMMLVGLTYIEIYDDCIYIYLEYMRTIV